jgi:hypothetical protein
MHRGPGDPGQPPSASGLSGANGPGKAVIVRTLLRTGLGALLGVLLVLGTAYAIEYHEIFELTDEGVSDEEIVRLIVEDGRAFEMSEDEIEDLRRAGVSEIVIDAMIDPEVGRAWLAGDYRDEDYDDGGGYATSLDEAYGQGYRDGRRTALVYSFGYYYGPLSRYYYDDPFYYSFWHAGYAYSYWPSYYAYWYRPAYSWCYSYPYNWYNYSSYYCYTYYDPGYWVANGYTVLPGYGRTIWDDGPRWRDGGLAPIKGGRPPSMTALRDRLTDGGRLRNPSGPPAIREAIASRTDRGVPTVRQPVARTPVSGRSPETRVGAGSGRRAPERGTIARGSERANRGNAERVTRGSERTTRGGNADRVTRGSQRVNRDVSSGRVARSRPERGPARAERGASARVERPSRVIRPAEPRVERGTRRETVGRAPVARGGGWSRSEDRIERRATERRATGGEARVIRGSRSQAPSRAERRARVGSERRIERREAPPAYDRQERSRGYERREEVRAPERREEPRYEPRREESRPEPPSRAGHDRPSRPERNDPPPSRGGDDDGGRGGRGRGGR